MIREDSCHFVLLAVIVGHQLVFKLLKKIDVANHCFLYRYRYISKMC